jgi:hypothetical protein
VVNQHLGGYAMQEVTIPLTDHEFEHFTKAATRNNMDLAGFARKILRERTLYVDPKKATGKVTNVGAKTAALLIKDEHLKPPE